MTAKLEGRAVSLPHGTAPRQHAAPGRARGPSEGWLPQLHLLQEGPGCHSQAWHPLPTQEQVKGGPSTPVLHTQGSHQPLPDHGELRPKLLPCPG